MYVCVYLYVLAVPYCGLYIVSICTQCMYVCMYDAIMVMYVWTYFHQFVCVFGDGQ